MTPKSLKGRLLWGISLCMLLLIFAGGLTTYLYFRSYLYAELDHALFDKLRFLRASCLQRGDEVVFELTEQVWARVQDDHDPEYFQIWLADGTTMHRSWETEGEELPDIAAGSREPVFADLLLPSGMNGRVAGQVIVPQRDDGSPGSRELVLAVAHDTGRIVKALAGLRSLISFAGVASGALVLAAAYLIVRRNLAPLVELSQLIDAIPVGAEQSRFALKSAPKELDPVVDRLNALMDRVDAALENERQFTANAAHELRNPLAGMRSQLELGLSKSRTPQEYRQALGGVLSVEKRLQSMVDNLLLLTRLQAGQDEVFLSEVPMPELLRRTWKPFFEEAEKKELEVSLECDPDLAPIKSSRDLLEIVLRNLFDNAVNYTEPGGRIQIRAGRNTTRAEVSVANTNPGLTREDLEKMFGRFWRASSAREGDHLHAGIGLTLTQKVMDALGGEIAARLRGDGMLEIGVDLPVEPA